MWFFTVLLIFLTVLLIVHQKSFCFDKGVDAIEAGDNLVGERKLCADFPQKFCATMYYIRYYILVHILVLLKHEYGAKFKRFTSAMKYNNIVLKYLHA